VHSFLSVQANNSNHKDLLYTQQIALLHCGLYIELTAADFAFCHKIDSSGDGIRNFILAFNFFSIELNSSTLYKAYLLKY